MVAIISVSVGRRINFGPFAANYKRNQQDKEVKSMTRIDIISGFLGAGKTTLFHVLMHEQELDSGTVSTGHLRIGYLPQEIILEDESCTVLEYLQSGRPIQKLENELKKTEARIEELEKRDKEIDETLVLPDVCTNVARCTELSREKEAVLKELEELYEKWESLA